MKNNKWLLKIKSSLFDFDNSPEMKSLSVAIGIFIAFSPFMGFHILMALACCAMFSKLDKALVIGFTLVNNWWTLVPIYGAGLWIGELILKTQHFNIKTVQWNMFRLRHILSGETFSYISKYLSPMIYPFILGSLILSFVVTIICYYCTLFILKKKLINQQKIEEQTS